MTQVICPGCAKLIEVGVLPAGTLPSCPYCRTVFQLPEVPAAELNRAPVSTRPSTSWRAAAWGLVIVLVSGGLLATILLLAITLLADREKQKGEPKNPAGTKNPSGSWQRIGDFSGHTHMQTRPFRVESSTWRMTWSCQANQIDAKKTFQVHVMDEAGKLVGTPITAHGGEGETTHMETEPGIYFLVIQARNVEWELKVEHQP